MKSATRVTIYDENGEKFFGEGPFRLLRAVEVHGSLRAAAQSMEMAYSKAVKLIRQAENALGFPLTERAIGGRDGGGSILTDRCQDFLAKYEAWREGSTDASRQQFGRIFAPKPEEGVACAIMASGLGRRFGSNKLMEDFGGTTMIGRILDATDGLFTQRIVVTRHDDVAALCREREIPVLRHDLPRRSDVIRLALAAIGGNAAGCIFCPADQPLLRRETLQRFADTAAEEPASILRLGCGGSCASPVLFPAWCFPELMQLPDGAGGRLLLEKHSAFVRTVTAACPEELLDADTPEDLESLRRFL